MISIHLFCINACLEKMDVIGVKTRTAGERNGVRTHYVVTNYIGVLTGGSAGRIITPT